MAHRTPVRIGEARGFAWGPLAPEVEGRAEAWLAGEVEGGDELKPGRVWRVDDLLVKRYPAPKGVARFRRSPALRAGDLHEVLKPLRTPFSVLAVEGRDQTGLLVCEFIEGRYLSRLWEDDPEGRAAFPAFMAQMHRQRVFHGDLNIRNMLWDGEEWVLIDLDGIVHGPRKLARKRLVTAQWARILGTGRMRPGSRELFDAYMHLTDNGWDPEPLWESIERQAAKFVATWDEQRASKLAAGLPVEPPQ